METKVQQPTDEQAERLVLVPVDIVAEDVCIGDRIRAGAADYVVTRKGKRGKAVDFAVADQVFTLGFDEFEPVTVRRPHSRADIYGALVDLMRGRKLPAPTSISVQASGDSFDVDLDVDTEDGFHRWADALGMVDVPIRRSLAYQSHPNWRQRLSIAARSYTCPTWMDMSSVKLAATINLPTPPARELLHINADGVCDMCGGTREAGEHVMNCYEPLDADMAEVVAKMDAPEPAVTP